MTAQFFWWWPVLGQPLCFQLLPVNVNGKITHYRIIQVGYCYLSKYNETLEPTRSLLPGIELTLNEETVTRIGHHLDLDLGSLNWGLVLDLGKISPVTNYNTTLVTPKGKGLLNGVVWDLEALSKEIELERPQNAAELILLLKRALGAVKHKIAPEPWWARLIRFVKGIRTC